MAEAENLMARSIKKIRQGQTLTRMFRSRAIVYLKTIGCEFDQTPGNRQLFDLLAEHFQLELSMPKRERLAACIALLDSKMNFEGKLNGSKKAHRSVDFYRSAEWRSLRYEALKASSGRCELCGDASGSGVVLHVDHIQPRSKCPERELDRTNLQVLCEDCNMGKGNRDNTDWRREPLNG